MFVKRAWINMFIIARRKMWCESYKYILIEKFAFIQNIIISLFQDLNFILPFLLNVINYVLPYFQVFGYDLFCSHFKTSSQYTQLNYLTNNILILIFTVFFPLTVARFGKICAYLESAQNSLQNNTQICLLFKNVFYFLISSTKFKKKSYFFRFEKKSCLCSLRIN